PDLSIPRGGIPSRSSGSAFLIGAHRRPDLTIGVRTESASLILLRQLFAHISPAGLLPRRRGAACPWRWADFPHVCDRAVASVYRAFAAFPLTLDHGLSSRPADPWPLRCSAGSMGATRSRVMDRSIGRPLAAGPNVMTTSLVRVRPGVAGSGTRRSSS